MAAQQNEILIAVMGMTGAGKSTFIKRVTGRDDVKVGHTLESATEEVIPYSFPYNGYNFTLIDTPGFDDSRFSDDVVVDKVLKWLKDSAKHHKELSGIIYMHRITDPRIQGTARSSMSMFRRLCGPEYFKNVVLGTTFWKFIDRSEGARRERELSESDDFWGLLVKRGSRICRVGSSTYEDRDLLLQVAKNKKSLVHAQEEMLAGVHTSETAAAKEVNKSITDWARILDQRLEKERAGCRRELEDLNRRRKQQFDARKAAIEEEQRRKREAELDDLKRAKLAWQARQEAQAAQAAHTKRQVEEFELKIKELAYQRKQKEQHEASLQQELHLKCRRPPVREIKCDRCKRHVNTRRSPFYHCCRCLSGGKSDNYDQCVGCGSRCKDSRHGIMSLCNQ